MTQSFGLMPFLSKIFTQNLFFRWFLLLVSYFWHVHQFPDMMTQNRVLVPDSLALPLPSHSISSSTLNFPHSSARSALSFRCHDL